jgi:hypothetical protein
MTQVVENLVNYTTFPQCVKTGPPTIGQKNGTHFWFKGLFTEREVKFGDSIFLHNRLERRKEWNVIVV